LRLALYRIVDTKRRTRAGWERGGEYVGAKQNDKLLPSYYATLGGQ